MSELINNSKERKARLKELILKLHQGETTEAVQQELLLSLANIPYGEVVEVEQELISEGLPEEEVLALCDAHSAVLDGSIDLSGMKSIPEGHPVEVIRKENEQIKLVAQRINQILYSLQATKDQEMPGQILELKSLFNQLMDVDKLYQRKEYLIFPFLEKIGITGPPKVMWGKHDEIRNLLKMSLEVLHTEDLTAEELHAASPFSLKLTVDQVVDMTKKEEEILLPMCLDELTEADWYDIHKQSLDIGFCLYDPPVNWKPNWVKEKAIDEMNQDGGLVRLPTGSFTPEELNTVLNSLPFDITFVDKNDKVKYFSHGRERIFQRNRAILNRDVRHCHPPSSAHIVDKIIDDFKSGRESRAPFWINMKGKMIHIEYFALRNEEGEYLGTLEVSHNITTYREIDGEQRILSYQK